MGDPAKAPDRIAGMFDAIAPRYDFLNHLLSAGIDRRWRRRAVKALSLSGGECVLDVCTGTGDLAIAARLAKDGARQVMGVDFAAAMLHVGRSKIAERHLSDSVAFVRADATRIPLRGASVDCVTVGFGIRNVADVGAACAEIRRVLKPGGRFAILEFAIPDLAGVRGVYLWYLQRVLPRVGRAISRDAAAYTYLPASVASFASPDEFVKILRQSGFVEVAATPLTLGIVFLYTGRTI